MSEGSCLKPAPYDLSKYKGESTEDIVDRLYTSIDGNRLSLCVLSQYVPSGKGWCLVFYLIFLKITNNNTD